MLIQDKTFPSERALYGSDDLTIVNCSFDGEEDGESALKESKNIKIDNCFFNLRYPLWHDDNVTITNSEMTEKCRAAIWYTNHISVRDSLLNGVKVFRECKDISVDSTRINSPECFWRCSDIKVSSTSIGGEYPFLMSSDIVCNNLNITGKYPFQYAENVTISNSVLNTKDPFWHAKNVVIKDSIISCEYLGWYSEDLTIDHCRIIGTQPLCYCKGLKLIDCEMSKTDLAFEYSEVEATVKGNIISVKNPLRGSITADSIGEIIMNKDSVYDCICDIRVNK